MSMLKSTTALAVALGLGLGIASVGPANATGQSGSASSEGQAGPAASGESQPGAGGTAGQMSTDKPSMGTAGDIAGGARAEDLVGRNVVNQQGEKVGEVEALVIQPEQNEPHAVISVGGFLGIGDHDVAIPLKELQVGEDNVTLMSQQTKEELKALPAYDETQYKAWGGDAPTAPPAKSQ